MAGRAASDGGEDLVFDPRSSLLAPLIAADFCLELLSPIASHFSLLGFVLPYPGQATPDLMHLLHAGAVKSQTRHRRRHSQQCTLGSPSIAYSGYGTTVVASG